MYKYMYIYVYGLFDFIVITLLLLQKGGQLISSNTFTLANSLS